MKYLPQKGLDKVGIRYFHTHMLLNKHYFLADENILHLNRETDCLLGEYPEREDDPIVILLIQYKNKTVAQEAYQAFLNVYLPEAGSSGNTKTENNKWSKIVMDGHFLIIILDAINEGRIDELLSIIKSIREEK